MLSKICSTALLGLIALHALPAAAQSPPEIFLDGTKLQLPANPIVVDGSTLVPMRALFEAQGAEITWSNKTQTVTANRDQVTFTYRIGENYAHKNGQRLSVEQPGKIVDGLSMVPLRFVSEALGSLVKWHRYSGSITISSDTAYENTIMFGVNLRVAPDALPQTAIVRMIPKGEKVHVLRELSADWLEVRTITNEIGFISAKPLYSDYSSASLAALQADKLLEFGAQYLGTPYEFGASADQTDTFDCSSFVRHVFKETLAVELPRVSYNQAKEGEAVDLNNMRKGDLLFFSARGLEIGHVGIYAGEGRILHTFSKEKGVHFGEFDETWKKRFVTARRVF